VGNAAGMAMERRNAQLCAGVGIATTSCTMAFNTIERKRSSSPAPEQSSPPPSPTSASAQKVAISNARHTVSALVTDSLTIDAERQARLDAKLAEKISDCEGRIAKLKTSPRKGNAEEIAALQQKVAALRQGDRRPASVTLPPLKKLPLEKKRSMRTVRWSLSPRSTSDQINVSPRASQTARSESKRTKDQRRYWALIEERKPLVQALHRIDNELVTLAAELNLPPPKPPAVKPPLPTGRSDKQPPSQL
jgi:hypothetical protein